MKMPPEILGTTRLMLHPPLFEDAAQIFANYAQDSEVTRYLIWRPHKSVEETTGFVERSIQGWKDGSCYPWVVTKKDDHALIGMIEMRIVGDEADIGYVLARKSWGQGYATEMAKAVVTWALQQPEIRRVWATCDCENKASARVLEKAGLRFEKVLEKYIMHPNISVDLRDSLMFSIED